MFWSSFLYNVTMEHSKTISLECPYCDTKCQFKQIDQSHRFCNRDGMHHIAYTCSNCEGVIATHWTSTTKTPASFQREDVNYGQRLSIYYPIVGDWKPRVDVSLITNDAVKEDFEESIKAYNNGLYNSCMMMARRAIQQEMISNGVKGDNLFKQIEATGISKKLKALLQKVKNFGNHGAHPDFCLFDEEGNEITDKKAFAKLSLEFLDRYFADEYEIDSLVEGAPKSQKELESKNL